MESVICEKDKDMKVVPAVRWEQVMCNLCGRDEGEPYHRERLPYFDEMLDFQIVRCRHCGLVYTNPRLADHNVAYLLGSSDNPEEIERHGQAKAAVFVGALNEIERLQQRSGNKTGGRLLDVGCGSGHFLAAARKRGFKVCGIEPACVSANYGVEKFGLEVIGKNILDVDLPAESFDVITAWDVIEHVADPQAVLERCADWLRPGGIMALRFPSATWQKIKAVILHQLLAGRRWVFGPTIHLYFFTEQTFTQIGQNVGLEVLRTKTTAAEANTNSAVLDQVKLASNMVIRGIEMVSGRHLGNLEVYCCKREGNLQNE